MPWSPRQVWRRVNAGMLIEEYCEPNNAFYFGYDVAPLPHADALAASGAGTWLVERLCRKRLQQAAVAFDGFMDIQALLDFPDARGDGLHDWHVQLAFEGRDQRKRF